jgi:hypothetical protein
MNKKQNLEIESSEKSNISLNKQDMITLFGYYISLLPSRWERAQNYFNFYVTLNVSIIGATIAGLTVFNHYPKNLVLIIGPILTFVVCIFAKKTIKRQDIHVRELVAMISKFGFELGLYEKLNLHNPKNGKYLWSNDESFILPRWVNERMSAGERSEDFINDFKIGSRKFSYHLFTVFQIFSLLLGLIIGFFPSV